jgi:transcriptional regulator with XRE-family HTH domain
VEPRDRFGVNLREARLAAGVSVEELSERCGLHHTMVSRLERGGAAPRLETLLKLAGVLGVSVEALCAGIAWDDRAQSFVAAPGPA